MKRISTGRVVPWCFVATLIAACSGSGGTGSSGDGGGQDGTANTGGSSGASSGMSSGGSSGSGSGGGSGSPGGDASASSGGASGSSSGAPGSSSGDGSSATSASSGSTDAGTEAASIACDSGGPLALEAVWQLPAVTPSGVAVDGQGNVYVTGTYTGTVVFGTTTLTGPTSAGNEDMFLVKYGSGGNVIFAKSYGTLTGIYTPPALAVDPSGDAFLGGAFAGTLAWGGGTTPIVAVSLDAFAVKISPTGATLWADRFGYNEGPYSMLSVAVGPDGDPVFAGTSAGPITIGSKTWPGSTPTGASQPFLVKLASADGSVVWSNASGGDIDVSYAYLALDATGRPFLAAEVESGGGAWGVEADAGVGYFGTMRAGFAEDGAIRWGQIDYGAKPSSASVDTGGRFSVLEYTFDGVTIGGGSDASIGASAGNISLVLLASPTDGTPISTFYVPDTFPWSSAADNHGNTLITGTFWPQSSPIPVGPYSIPAVSGSGQPLFVAAVDGASHGVGAATLGPDNDAQPVAIAVDATSGKVYVPGTLSTAFTSTAGALRPGAFIAVFGPDPCDDGAGPLGSATGNPSNHGDLGPDAGSPYYPADAGSPAPCPGAQSGATNGAACPVAMGCSYGTTCCFCTPTACGAQPTTWTCNDLGTPAASCPATPPSPQAACPGGAQCNYCLPGGRFFATCTAGGWETGYAQLVCE